MAILDSLIIASCVGLSGQQNIACTNALQAGTKQSGIEQSTNSYEQRNVKKLEGKAVDWFGKDAVGIVGSTAWAAKAAIEKRASFGITRNISAEIGKDLTRLVLKWTF